MSPDGVAGGESGDSARLGPPAAQSGSPAYRMRFFKKTSQISPADSLFEGRARRSKSVGRWVESSAVIPETKNPAVSWTLFVPPARTEPTPWMRRVQRSVSGRDFLLALRCPGGNRQRVRRVRVGRKWARDKKSALSGERIKEGKIVADGERCSATVGLPLSPF